MDLGHLPADQQASIRVLLADRRGKDQHTAELLERFLEQVLKESGVSTGTTSQYIRIHACPGAQGDTAVFVNLTGKIDFRLGPEDFTHHIVAGHAEPVTKKSAGRIRLTVNLHHGDHAERATKLTVAVELARAALDDARG
ncbi:hypothetical protein [Streptomyces sp. NPDC000410]|uniref:hypothetical protein n=1 Tax=Streptomyces sp. NPDC000410 TaxID=3154254 RepID=UPI00331C341C